MLTEVTVLHDHPKYLDECADILNEEWPRSKTARLHSLKKSCDKFPVCLVLIDTQKDEVIGHSKLSTVHGKQKSLFIESVLVRNSLRGKGLGRLLMDESEKFAHSHGYTTMYLSTHDKQLFYQHLGYEFCSPVVSFGGNPDLLPQSLMELMKSQHESSVTQVGCEDSVTRTCILNHSTIESNNQDCPPHTGQNGANSTVEPSKDPSGAPLPPPPPPVVCKPSKADVVKWDPRHMSWMKKDLIYAQ